MADNEANTGKKRPLRILISGGPGSGCTSTGKLLGERLGISCFDSDDFFHKPTDPPFQEQYSMEERRDLIISAMGEQTSWIVSGSVATWGLDNIGADIGVFLKVPRSIRLRRLEKRQRGDFGERIESGGEMYEEHQSFVEWAGEYERDEGIGRNLETDRRFLESRCETVLSIDSLSPLEEVVESIVNQMRGGPGDVSRLI